MLSATQHFSAGILLAAIGLELLPKLISNGKGLWGSVAIAVGFAAGVVLMLGVKYVTEKLEPEEDSDDEEEDTGKESSALLASGDSAGSAYGSNAAAIDIPEAKATFDGEARALSPRDRFKKAVSAVKFINRMKRGADKRAVSRIAIAMRSAELKRHLSRPAMQKELAEPSADPEPEPELGPFPLSLSMAVGVDSIMDGVLLGIVYVVSTHAGQIMAVATAIEMLFLGVTYSVSVQPHGCLKSAFAVVLQPVLLVAGGAIGAAATNELSDNPNIFVGVIAFGIATLLCKLHKTQSRVLALTPSSQIS